MPVPRDAVRPLGVVYTPEAVARAMVRVALEPLCAGRGVDELLALRVCDPAIGEGVFVVEIARYLGDAIARAGGSPAARRAALERCIAGVDIDARAVDIARAALRRLGARRDGLAVGDALATAWAERFDAVIGNPPYVRQEWLDGKQPLRSFASYDGVADLYVYFLELAHRIARPGGRYCFVTPNKWLTAAYGAPLRAFLAAQRSVEGIVDLGRTPLFAEDAFPCITWGTVGGAPGDIAAARAEPGVDFERALASASPHPRECWRDGPWHIDHPEDRALVDRLHARWPRLGDVLPGRPSRGLVTGCNRAFVIDGATRAQILEQDPAAAAWIRPFVKGRDLRRWRPERADRWILLVDHGTALTSLGPAIAAHLARFRRDLEPRKERGPGAGRKPGTYRWHELQDPVGALTAARSPRLLYQDIQTEPACGLAGEDDVPDTTVWMLPTGDRTLLAILNSPLYRWYAQRRFPPALNGAVRPKASYLRELPVAQPPPALRAKLEALVDERLALFEPATLVSSRRNEPVRPEPELDAAIADLVLDAYELDTADRVRLRQR